jgi:capsular polysaccharide biosynthesis protein
MLPSTRRRRDGSQERRQSQRQGWQREQRDDLTLSEAWHILLERRVLVAGCTILFLAVALLYAFSKEPVYTAEAVLSVRSEEGIAPAGNPDEILSRLRDSTVMDGLSEEAARRAGWEANQSDFNDRLYWEPMNDREVEISFSGRTPQGASGAANAYAEALVERVGELEGRFAGGTVAVDAEVEKAAEPPERRSDRREVFLVAIAAGCGGLLVGGVGALFLEGRAHRWSGSRDAELTLRAPVLGVIPDFSDDSFSGNFSGDGGVE